MYINRNEEDLDRLLEGYVESRTSNIQRSLDNLMLMMLDLKNSGTANKAELSEMQRKINEMYRQFGGII